MQKRPLGMANLNEIHWKLVRLPLHWRLSLGTYEFEESCRVYKIPLES